MPVLHDIRCTECSWEQVGAYVDPSAFPPCEECGEPTTWVPRGFFTDMREPVYNHATGQWHSSTREADMEVARLCRKYSDETGIRLEASSAGDKVGGARNETRLRGTAASYAGQRSRRSTGERAAGARGGQSAVPRSTPRAPASSDRYGLAPRRMDKDTADTFRKSKVWK